jgi:hypothetical protein
MLNSVDRICATRALKNARYLQRVAPHIMPEVSHPKASGASSRCPFWRSSTNLRGMHGCLLTSASRDLW